MSQTKLLPTTFTKKNVLDKVICQIFRIKWKTLRFFLTKEAEAHFQLMVIQLIFWKRWEKLFQILITWKESLVHQLCKKRLNFQEKTILTMTQFSQSLLKRMKLKFFHRKLRFHPKKKKILKTLELKVTCLTSELRIY